VSSIKLLSRLSNLFCYDDDRWGCGLFAVVLLVGSIQKEEQRKDDKISKLDMTNKVMPSPLLDQPQDTADQHKGKALIMQYVRSITPVSFKANLSTWGGVIRHLLNHTR
jgi:hypothetical protein